MLLVIILKIRSGTIGSIWQFSLLTVLIAAAPLLGEDRHELGTLKSPEPEFGDGFGHSIAHYGDYLAVGAPGLHGSRDKERAGDVYLYKFDGATTALIKHFPGPIDPTDRRFGLSVALGDGILAISGDTYRGSTDERPVEFYIYERDEPSEGMWGHSFTVTATGDSHGDNHVQVKINNGMVVGSIPGFRKLVLARKSAGNWTTTEIEEEPQDTFFTGFGNSFDVDDLRIAVGAPLDKAENGNRGAVQLYAGIGSSWFEGERLRPPIDDAPWFGEQVALAGSSLAVLTVSGDVFLYGDRGAGWKDIATLSFHRHASVDLEGEQLLMGVPQLTADQVTLNRSGGAHLHRMVEIEEGKSLQPLIRFVPSQPINGHQLGGTVLLSNQWAFVATEVSSRDSGTVYWFDRSLQPTISYAEWKEELSKRGFDTVQSAQDSVLNLHGISNGTCFAMGIDAVAPSPDDIPRWKWSDTHRSQIFAFQRSRYVSGVSLQLESSTDLNTWEPIDPERMLESSIKDRTEISFHIPWWEPNATGYLRLKAIFDE